MRALAVITGSSRNTAHPRIEAWCPFLHMVREAENRAWRSVTKTWIAQPESGFNLFLDAYLEVLQIHTGPTE